MDSNHDLPVSGGLCLTNSTTGRTIYLTTYRSPQKLFSFIAMLPEILLGILLAVLLYGFGNRKPKNLPPGVWGLPVIGKVPSREITLSDQVTELVQKFGKITSWRIGGRLFIFLSDYTAIKNVFSKADLTDRPDLYAYRLFNDFTERGILFGNGESWQNNRRFALRHLKDLGMGKTRLEEAIQYEASCLVKDLEMCVGKPSPLPWSINVAVLNVIWQLVAGRRFDVEDPEMQYFNQVYNDAVEETQKNVLFFDFLPWTIPLMPDLVKRWLGFTEVKEKLQIIFSLMKDHIREHQETLNPEDPRDYIDAYLIEMEAQKDNAQSTMNIEDLTMCLIDLYGAGSETTSTTLRWAIYYLVKNPRVQTKIQEEIDSIVPRDVQPSMLQKSSMPYLEAVTLEVHRIASLVPLGIFHLCNQDTEIEGYIIPKGALVAAHIEGCHKDPSFWEKPSEFYPEHFLDADGKLLSRNQGLLPFCLGRRQCLGESLARAELFIFLSSLLQTFTFSAPEGVDARLEKEPTMSVLNMPKPMNVVITKRK